MDSKRLSEMVQDIVTEEKKRLLEKLSKEFLNSESQEWWNWEISDRLDDILKNEKDY